MEQPRKILIGKDLDQSYIDKILDKYPWVEVDTCTSEEEQERKLSDVDILFTRVIPKTTLKAPKLRWVQFMWEGIDEITEDFRDSKIILTNAGGAHTIPIAEHTFTFILDHEKRSFLYHAYQKKREWLGWKNQPKLGTLHGKTIGIIGYGRIGRAIAGIAKGFGMKVLAMKRTPADRSRSDLKYATCCDKEGKIPSEIHGPEGLHHILSNSDHIVLSLPLTEDTNNFIGPEEFKSMKKGTFLVNIGRGALIDEKALMAALDGGSISGAGLDVFKEEPLPPENPLWAYENVMITPHSSVGGDPADDQVVDIFIENLQRYIDGIEMINVIDKKRGY